MNRTVFDNAMTAHVWAQQNQQRGQSHNGNLWFEGRALYSYGTHYVLGYALPCPESVSASGFLFLLNSDDSSVTTNGKHKPAARRAVRGAPVYVPNLGGLAAELDRLHHMARTAAERVRAVAAHFESLHGTRWPGAEAVALVLRAVGCPEAEAERRARAGQARIDRAEAHRAAKAAKAELESNARAAKRLARQSLAETAAEVRDLLAEAAGSSTYRAQQKEAEAAELGREAHRAAKAAKAKGWARIAAACRAHHAAVRAEILRYKAHVDRYALRAQLRRDIKALRGAPEQIRQFWALNPDAAEGATPPDLGRAVTSCETGARGFSELAAALGRLCESRYAAHGFPGPVMLAARKAEAEARELAEALRLRAGGYRMAQQAEARAEWLAGGNPRGYQVGRLCDARGAALLRAEGVERDDSGAIIGGTLRTSWGASVPLPHAIRAFRFLRLCRDTGQEWRANGRTLRVGHFRVDHVDAAGNFVAGCHRISWAEAARVAASLGLAELAGADTTEGPLATA